MNKHDIAERVSANTRLNKAVSELVVNTVFDIISDAVISGDVVRIHGFGTFSSSERAERKGRDIKKHEVVVIPSCRVFSFRPSDKVNQKLN